jgi:hypothetical protein
VHAPLTLAAADGRRQHDPRRVDALDSAWREVADDNDRLVEDIGLGHKANEPGEHRARRGVARVDAEHKELVGPRERRHREHAPDAGLEPRPVDLGAAARGASLRFFFFFFFFFFFVCVCVCELCKSFHLDQILGGAILTHSTATPHSQKKKKKPSKQSTKQKHNRFAPPHPN